MKLDFEAKVTESVTGVALETIQTHFGIERIQMDGERIQFLLPVAGDVPAEELVRVLTETLEAIGCYDVATAVLGAR